MVDILAIGAHPDDVEITSGGTLARASARGQSVVIADLTQGEMGTRGTPQERAGEAQAAAQVLGAAARENLDLGDAHLHDDGPRREAVILLIRRHRPRLVIAPNVVDDHPDHAATGQIVKAAFYLAGLRKVLPQAPAHRAEMLLYFLGRSSRAPSFLVDVSAVHERKLESIRCHRSQLFDPTRNEPQTRLSTPTFLEGIIARDRAFGALCGVRFAEGFLVDRPPCVDDLLHFLRSPP